MFLVSLAILVGFVWFIVSAVRRSAAVAERERRVAVAARMRTAEITQQAKVAAQLVVPQGVKFPVGRTTGTFRSRGHRGAPPAERPIWMGEPDLAQGLLCVGPPGSGKTLLTIIPFVQWMASAESVGIFAPAVKRDFADTLEREIDRHRSGAIIHRIGPGFARWNLMDSLAPDAVAGFIRTVGERRGGAADSTWSDAATSHAQSCALLLWSLTDGGTEPFQIVQTTSGGTDQVDSVYRYNFVSLHRLANIQGETWAEASAHARATAAVLRLRGDGRSEERAEQIEIALEARKLEFDDLGDKTRSSVLMNINSVLGPLTKSVDLRRAFASETDIRLTDLDAGHAIILDIDMDKYRGSAEFLFMLAFEQFSGFALRRMTYADNLVAFIGDEFQQYASERAIDFFALSRQAKIVPCLAFQTVSRLISKVGKKENAHAILSTFGSSLWFPTSDPETIQFVTQVVGQADVSMVAKATAEGETSGDSSSAGFTMQSGSTGQSSGTSRTTTTSTALQQRSVVDAHLLRTLSSTFPPRGGGGRASAQVVGFVRSGGRLVDDVLMIWGPMDRS